MIGDFSESESLAILSWMDTFSCNQEFRDAATGTLTLDSIQDGMAMLHILQDAEPSYFSYVELEPQTDYSGKIANLHKIADSIDNFLLQTHQLWTGPKCEQTRIELIVRQTIGVALKSQRSAIYIEQVMALDDEAQEHLGEIVQNCLEAIYEGTSSRSSTHSVDAAEIRSTSEDGSKSGRIGLDADDINLGSSQITVDERKHRDLQRQALIAERECQQLREQNTDLERSVALLKTENEQLKSQVYELDGTSKGLEHRIEEELSKQRMQMDKEIAAYQAQHAYEQGDKDKRIAELETEMSLVERQHEERLYRLQAELDDFKEQVGSLKRNEAMVEVYKKKVDQMADMRIELNDAQELNQKLYSDIEILQRETEKDQVLEGMVEKLQHELGKVKQNSDLKDLKMQEVSFQLRDSESRISEYEQKENFYKTQIEKLTTEVTVLQEEIKLMKKETEDSARADTQKADLKDKYNALLVENKMLQKQINSKINAEKFAAEQEIQEAKGKLSVAEAKNTQLEQRITTLEGRLAGQKDNDIVMAAMQQQTEQVEQYERQDTMGMNARGEDGFNPQLNESPPARSKSTYVSSLKASESRPLQQPALKDQPFQMNLSVIQTTNLNESEADGWDSAVAPLQQQHDDSAEMIFISPRTARDSRLSSRISKTYDQIDKAEENGEISAFNDLAQMRTTGAMSHKNPCDNFDNKSMDHNSFRNRLHREEIEMLTSEKEQLEVEIDQLKQSVRAREEMLRAKEMECVERLKEKDAWVAEQKRAQMMRVRILTEKITNKLGMNKNQADLLKKI